jgi:hypothetical protein
MSITSDHIKSAIMVVEYKKKFGFYPKDTSAENIAKTKYRLEEHKKLKTISNIITITYYSFLIVLFMLLFSSSNLLINERWMLYLFLILLPFIYPWVFMGIISLKNAMFQNNETGSKTSFIDNSLYHLKYDV